MNRNRFEYDMTETDKQLHIEDNGTFFRDVTPPLRCADPIKDIDAGFFIEVVFRDANFLTGAMQDRLDRACRIVREITGHSEGARQE